MPLTIDEAANESGVPAHTLRHWIKTGRLRAEKSFDWTAESPLVTDRWYIDEDELERALGRRLVMQSQDVTGLLADAEEALDAAVAGLDGATALAPVVAKLRGALAAVRKAQELR